jgi:hypothetical protein
MLAPDMENAWIKKITNVNAVMVSLVKIVVGKKAQMTVMLNREGVN